MTKRAKTDEKPIPDWRERERIHWEEHIRMNPYWENQYKEWEKIDPRIMEAIRSTHALSYLGGYTDTKKEIEKSLKRQVASFLENI